MAVTPKEQIRQWWIYKITNPKGRVYIGKSCSINNRMSAYKTVGASCKQQPLIYNSLLKYGADNHCFEIIDSFESNTDYASGKEIFWIRSYMSNESKWRMGLGLNLTDGGEGTLGVKILNRPSSFKGKKHTEEFKRRESERAKANPSRGMLGKKHTQASKDAMSKNKKGKPALHRVGKPLSEDTKRKISVANKGRKSPNAGKSLWSDSDRKRIGNSKLGNKYNLGRTHTDVARKNIATAAIEKQGIPIYQYDLSGTFIREFKAVRVAARELGISHKCIFNNANGLIKNPKFFIFKYTKQ